MATIDKYELKSGTFYRVRYRTPEGRQTDKRGFKRKKDAEAWAATLEVSKLTGAYVPDSAGRITIRDLGPTWLELKNVKPSHYRSLESSWRVHVKPYWADHPIGKITKTQVQTWINKSFEGKSPTVVLRAHGVLAGILDLAIDEQLLVQNKARGVVLPKKTRGMTSYLSWEQLHRLTVECGDKGNFVLFLATTGLRWGEAVALQGKHIDRKKRRITVERNYAQVGNRYELGTPKSAELRTVPVPSTTLDRVPLVMPEVHVWRAGAEDKPIPRPSPESGWFDAAVSRLRAADEHFPRVTPHDLRHTAASLAVSAGANVKALQRMLGHASASMTLDVYADLFDDDLDAVAVALEQNVGRMWAGA